MLKCSTRPSNLYTFILTSLLDFLSKYDYFHIQMDFLNL